MDYLELHEVRILAVAEGEVSREVISEELDLLDRGDDGLIDLLLELSAGSSRELVLLVELCLSLAGDLVDAKELCVEAALVEGLVLLEGLVSDAREVDALKLDLGAGGEKVVLGNAAERDTVEAEWAGDKEEARLLELLQEDDALASETAGKDDADSAGDKALAELADAGCRDSLGAGLDGALLVLGIELVFAVEKQELYVLYTLAVGVGLCNVDLIGENDYLVDLGPAV